VVLTFATSTSNDYDPRVMLVIGLVVAAVAIYRLLQTGRSLHRELDIQEIAAKAGLHYAETDPFDGTRVAFDLFTKGDGRGAENVLWRDAGDDGRSFRAFDYWYYEETQDRSSGTSKTYHRFSCAMAYIGSSFPDLTVMKEGLLAKAMSAAAGGDIDFESEEFNRMFAVQCDDRRFASALIDPRMIDVLLSTKGELTFSFRGRWLLIWRKQVPAKLLPGLLAVAERVVATIPKVVWDLYPSAFANPDGTVVPADDAVLLGKLEPSVIEAQREMEAEKADADRVEYDLDGHLLPTAHEDPWGDGRPPLHPQS
jgi:hypothetical protein